MRDSGLFSDGFMAGEHHRKEWLVERERIQSVRGKAIVAAFEVEDEVCRAIGDLVLPFRRSAKTRPWLNKRHEVLRRVILDRMDFRAKCETMCALMEHLHGRQAKDIKRLKSTLERVRVVRNNFAHCPIVFEAQRKRSRGKWLKPILMTAKGDCHVSSGYVAAFEADVGSARDLIGSIMRRGLRVRPPKVV